jgi:hypothetical protein
MMTPQLLRHKLVRVLPLSLAFGLSLSTSIGWAASVQDVVLKDGKTYQVLTEQGIPLPVRTTEIEVTAFGPMISKAKSQWYLGAKLQQAGEFMVTATTPLDPSASVTFDCSGPGPISQLMFAREQFPALWEWFDEPSTSWIPIVFRFTDKRSGRSFVIMQWAKIDASAKVSTKRALRELGGQ